MIKNMRIHGTLKKWNDERGFGFLEISGSDKEIFIHISAFPRDRNRPRIGKMVRGGLVELVDLLLEIKFGFGNYENSRCY